MEQGYHLAAQLGDIPRDFGLMVEVEGKSIGLFRYEERVYAIGGTCSHRAGPLGEGELEGRNVLCPWDGWEYDVTTGECETIPGERVSCHLVKVEGDNVYVALS